MLLDTISTNENTIFQQSHIIHQLCRLMFNALRLVLYTSHTHRRRWFKCVCDLHCCRLSHIMNTKVDRTRLPTEKHNNKVFVNIVLQPLAFLWQWWWMSKHSFVLFIFNIAAIYRMWFCEMNIYFWPFPSQLNSEPNTPQEDCVNQTPTTHNKNWEVNRQPPPPQSMSIGILVSFL